MDLDREWDYLGLVEHGLLSRPLDVQTDYGPLRIARDALNREHLLVPVAPGRSLKADRSTKGVELQLRELDADGQVLPFVALASTDNRYSHVFKLLANDVANQIKERSDTDPVDVLRQTLDNWRDLFRSPPQPVERWKVLGLMGELVVLSRMAQYSPIDSVELWTGPEGGHHDFVGQKISFEVKTTEGRSRRVSIHGLEQLEYGSAEKLALILVEAVESPAGHTVQEQLGILDRLGVPAGVLEDRLRLVGYDPRNPDPWDQYRWTIEAINGWIVDDDFPGLRAADVAPGRLKGVHNLNFILDLDAAPEPVETEGLEELFQSISQATAK